MSFVFAPSLGFCVVKFFVVKLGLSAGTRNGVSLRNAFGKLFARFSEGKPCDNKQHDNINARQCNTSARDAEQLCKRYARLPPKKPPPLRRRLPSDHAWETASPKFMAGIDFAYSAR